MKLKFDEILFSNAKVNILYYDDDRQLNGNGNIL